MLEGTKNQTDVCKRTALINSCVGKPSVTTHGAGAPGHLLKVEPYWGRAFDDKITGWALKAGGTAHAKAQSCNTLMYSGHDVLCWVAGRGGSW